MRCNLNRPRSQPVRRKTTSDHVITSHAGKKKLKNTGSRGADSGAVHRKMTNSHTHFHSLLESFSSSFFSAFGLYPRCNWHEWAWMRLKWSPQTTMWAACQLQKELFIHSWLVILYIKKPLYIFTDPYHKMYVWNHTCILYSTYKKNKLKIKITWTSC